MLERLDGTTQSETARVKLWRFMDFTKYVAMLHECALFFTRADQLPDPFEGLIVKRQRRARDQADPAERLRRRVFLSCWHQNEHESAAMWRIYLSGEDGVAIRSSVQRLTSIFESAPEHVCMGAVRYLDYAHDHVPERHELDPFFCKRSNFDYEREVRIAWPAARESHEPGRYLKTDLEQLIEQVVVSPSAEAWFEELVCSVTQRYGFKLPIAASSMNSTLDP